MKRTLTAFFLCFSLILSAQKAPVQLRSFRFLNKTFESGKLTAFESTNQKPELEIAAFLRHVKADKGEDQLKKLQEFRNSAELNDWLYFKLIRALCLNISEQANIQSLYSWYFLSRSGYEARIIGQEQKLFVFVHSRDSVYEDSYFSLGKKIFVRLPVNGEPDGENGFYLYNFHFLEGIRTFSLNDSRAPSYQPARVYSRQISFTHRDKTYSYSFETDPELTRLYADKPNGGLRYTFTAGLSPVACASLLPQVRADLKVMSTYEGIQFLLSLTRNSFRYRNDLEKGKEHYMTAEETLLAEESDCEDRAALFYYLVKELYQLPMLVVLYPAHVTIAVDFGEAYGQAINFRGKKYSICEPTGLELKIGEAPDFTQNQEYSILMAYRPN